MLNLMSPSGKAMRSGLIVKLSATGLIDKLIAKPMTVCWRYNMNYVAVFIGLIVMCVPEDASMLRFAFQGLVGLSIFMVGIISLINEEPN